MREIKFRGKRVDTGEWVYGYLIVTNKDNKSFIQDCDYSSVSSVLGGVTTYCLSSYHYSQVEVIPETVGQATGLKDKNGKEIYEGDIVSFTANRWNNTMKGEIKYNQTATKFIIDMRFQKFGIGNGNVEVISTIHDKEVK